MPSGVVVRWRRKPRPAVWIHAVFPSGARTRKRRVPSSMAATALSSRSRQRSPSRTPPMAVMVAAEPEGVDGGRGDAGDLPALRSVVSAGPVQAFPAEAGFGQSGSQVTLLEHVDPRLPVDAAEHPQRRRQVAVRLVLVPQLDDGDLVVQFGADGGCEVPLVVAGCEAVVGAVGPPVVADPALARRSERLVLAVHVGPEGRVAAAAVALDHGGPPAHTVSDALDLVALVAVEGAVGLHSHEDLEAVPAVVEVGVAAAAGSSRPAHTGESAGQGARLRSCRPSRLVGAQRLLAGRARPVVPVPEVRVHATVGQCGVGLRRFVVVVRWGLEVVVAADDRADRDGRRRRRSLLRCQVKGSWFSRHQWTTLPPSTATISKLKWSSLSWVWKSPSCQLTELKTYPSPNTTGLFHRCSARSNQ